MMPGFTVSFRFTVFADAFTDFRYLNGVPGMKSLFGTTCSLSALAFSALQMIRSISERLVGHLLL